MDISGYRNRGKCCVGLISWCSNLTKIEVSFFSKETKPLDIEIDNSNYCVSDCLKHKED